VKFIILWRFKAMPTKEGLARVAKLMEQTEKGGAKYLGNYWTLGRYDGVSIVEGKDEKSAMKALLPWGEHVSTETLVAVPHEEAAKLVG